MNIWNIKPGYLLITISDDNRRTVTKNLFGLTRDEAGYYFSIANLFLENNHGFAHIFTYGEDVKDDINEIYNDFKERGKIIPDLPVDEYCYPLIENLISCNDGEYYGCLTYAKVLFIDTIKDITSEFE